MAFFVMDEPKQFGLQPWEVSRAEYEQAIMPRNELTPEQAQALDHITEVRRNWKKAPDAQGIWQIYPQRKDVNVDPKIWRSLAKKGYVEDRGFGADVTITGWCALEISKGRNPWLGAGYKTHRQIVEEALKAGKQIPAEVLAEYPDLQPKTMEESSK